MELRLAAVAPDFEIVVEGQAWRPPPAEGREIDRLWDQEMARSGGRLLDASLLAYVHADRRRLVGRFVRRRDLFAAQRAPQLFGAHRPAPVGLSSMVTTRGRVVLGRRAAQLEQWPGCWELVPACGIDPAFQDPQHGRIDFAGRLLAELVEHTPLRPPARSAVRPLALACQESGPSWSLCATIELDLGDDAVAQLERSTSATYDAFRVVRPVDVIEAGLWDGDVMVPLSWALVRLPRVETQAA